jgi:hypothetical protein
MATSHARQPADTLSEDVLRRLDFLFAGDTVLERALEALDAGAVVRLEAPTGRTGEHARRDSHVSPRRTEMRPPYLHRAVA